MVIRAIDKKLIFLVALEPNKTANSCKRLWYFPLTQGHQVAVCGAEPGGVKGKEICCHFKPWVPAETEQGEREQPWEKWGLSTEISYQLGRSNSSSRSLPLHASEILGLGDSL